MPGLYYLMLGGYLKQNSANKCGIEGLFAYENQSNLNDLEQEDVLLVPLPVLNDEFQPVMQNLQSWHSNHYNRVDSTKEQLREDTDKFIKENMTLEKQNEVSVTI